MARFHALLTAALVGLLPAVPVEAEDLGSDVDSIVLLQEAALADPGLTLPADGQIRIVLPEGTPAKALALDGFAFDHRAGRFAARLVLADGSRHGLRGQAIVTVPAMVPVRRLAPGETITEADLAPADVPLATLPGSALRKARDLIGKEVQRTLPADRPVIAGSVREPRAIRRGEQVLIAFSGDGIELTAPGRALQDGALGEAIRVVNLSSNRTITAIAAGSGRVTVE